MPGPALRAVGADEKAPPREPMTVTTAARDGTTRDLLVALRTRIATTVESSDTPPRDLAALSKRLTDISKEIEPLNARAEEQGRLVAKSKTASPSAVAARGRQVRRGRSAFDGWQHGIASIALGKTADGKYASTVGGIVLSIPRQVGKTFVVGMIVIALCLNHPNLTVLWSAYRTKTPTKTFGALKAMTSRRKMKPFMFEPRNVNGLQGIRFLDGSVLMFAVRGGRFTRGFEKVHVDLSDEAQMLAERADSSVQPLGTPSGRPTPTENLRSCASHVAFAADHAVRRRRAARRAAATAP